MKASAKKIIFRLFDLLSAPFIYPVLPLLRIIRKHGVHRFPINRKMFLSKGVFPIRNHYYEPQLVYSKNFDAGRKRKLLIDFRLDKQLQNLSLLQHSEEMQVWPLEEKPADGKWYLHNGHFGPGDADLYYLLLRNIQPKKIIEIGSGFSTLVCLEALKKNHSEGKDAELICIEPFETPWLENSKELRLIRQNAETIDISLFRSLEENDILFIDSSHIIRPENDVLFVYLELLPQLNKGVLIHIHDIFSPRHYRAEWLQEEFRFWNEQYLLEAFLYYNDSFEIVYSLNHLKNDAFAESKKTLVHIGENDEPSSIWLRKIK